jgi:tetratricopeptide (TPR) repeat protein
MIFTFYGFKGGVGRTSALVHAASILASTRGPYGNRVLVMDLDLEAPSVFLHFPPSDPGQAQRGFAELMIKYLSEGRDGAWLRDELQKTVYRAADDLFVLPSGNYTASAYLEAIQRLADAHAAGFFTDLKAACDALYDYVLIDSRTGLAEVAAAATILLGDVLVACFRPNQANLGIGMIVQRFLAQHNWTKENPAARVVPLLTPRPAAFSPGARKWATLFQQEIFGPHAVVEVPFDPVLEAGDQLVIPPGSVTAKLDDGRVTFCADERGDLGAPIVKAYLELAERLASYNTERDVIAARKAELVAFLEGRYVDALNYLFQAIRRHPEEREQWNVLMRRYVPAVLDQYGQDRSGREIIREFLNECLGSGERAIQSPHGRAWAHIIRAAKFGNGTEDALPDVNEALRLAGDDLEIATDAHFLAAQMAYYRREKPLIGVADEVGFLHSRTRTLQSALDHLDKAGAAGGETERILRFRGQVHAEIGDYDRAVDDFDHAVARSSTPAEPLLESALALEHIGRYGDAIRRFLAAADAAPSNEEVYRRFVPTLYRLSYFDESLQRIQRWQKINPVSPEPFRHLLGLAVTKGSTAEIEMCLQRVRETDHANNPVFAWALMRLGRFEEASNCVGDSMDAGGYERFQLVAAFASLGKEATSILALPAESPAGGQFLAIAAAACGELELAGRHLDACIAVEAALPLAWRTNLRLVESILEASTHHSQRRATDTLLASLRSNAENAVWTRNQVEMPILRDLWRRFDGNRAPRVAERWDEIFGVWDSVAAVPFSRYAPFVLGEEEPIEVRAVS